MELVTRAGKRKSLETWIAEALTDLDKEGACTAFSLVHKQGMADHEVHTTRIQAGNARSPKELAELFRGKAETYSQDLAGSQTFVLHAFYGKSEPEASHPFTIAPNNDTNGLATEAPTAQGSMQQGMRLTEQFVQATFRERQMMMQYQFQIIERLSHQNEKLAAENADAFEIVRTMLMDKVKLDHESRMREMQYARSTKEREKWLSFAPQLLNTVTGKEIFPQTTADTALVEAMAEAIPPEMLQHLSGMFPPEVVGTIMARFETHMKKKRLEQEETERLLGIEAKRLAAE